MNIYEIKSTTWRCSDTISYKNYSFFWFFFFYIYHASSSAFRLCMVCDD